MNGEKGTATGFDKFKSVKPRAVRLSPESLVRFGYMRSGESLPLLVQPEVEELDLVGWAERHRDQIEEQLLKHGAMLFRGFVIETASKFEQFARAISPELMEYGERSSPRSILGNGIYTSTDHPADQYITLHNEQSYTLNWPMKIWFYCHQPAQQNGRTPIADSRKIYKRLGAKVTGRFIEKGVMYVRNYGDGLGLPWQEVFRTDSRSMVEEYCRHARIEFEWRDNSCLRTRQVRPAVRNHPQTGETVWFNHALFFNAWSLDAATLESMLAVVDEEDLPFNTFYGDGSPIKPSILEEIRQAYTHETVSFLWRHGDILMLDNMLVAHGREPFVGPRQIVVAMAEPFK